MKFVIRRTHRIHCLIPAIAVTINTWHDGLDAMSENHFLAIVFVLVLVHELESIGIFLHTLDSRVLEKHSAVAGQNFLLRCFAELLR